MKHIEDQIRFGPDGDKIREEARRALEEADAFGVFPTPVHQIMEAANLEEMPEEALDEGFLKSIRKKAGTSTKALKRALSKVLGVFDSTAGLVYVGRVEYPARKLFLRLHETAHGWLKWQRDTYKIVEDCEQTISPDIADRFDAEANLFASETLFQLDTFTEQANDEPFGLRAPLKVSKRFGASAYASIRRYVNTSDRCCAVVILNQLERNVGMSFRAEVRRIVASRSFLETMGDIELPKYITPMHPLGKSVPLYGKMSRPKELPLFDRNGDIQECISEGFDSTHQIFILICLQKSLTKRSIIVPSQPLTQRQ